jgi:hypothetical protein
MIAIVTQKFNTINCFWTPLFLYKKIVANDSKHERVTVSIKNKLVSTLKKRLPLSSSKTGSSQIKTEVVAARKSQSV